MTRCFTCDAAQGGLSNYRSDGQWSAHKFHQMPNGDILCDECYQWDKELESDFDLEDTIRDEDSEFFTGDDD